MHAVPAEQYLPLLKRLLPLNMIKLHYPSADLSPVGIFAVPKAGSEQLRMIADARPGNARRTDGVVLDVKLPSPADLAAIRVPPGAQLLKSKHDILSMFHQLRTPDWMHKLFALPPLLPAQLRVLGLDPYGPSVPCLATLPMGFEDSVFLAQAIIEYLLEPIIPRDRFLQHRPDINEGPVVSPYIDDINPLALVQHRDAFLIMDAAIASALDRVRLPSNTSKRVLPTIGPIDIMGCAVRDGPTGPLVSPSVKRKIKIFSLTLTYLRAGKCSGKDMEILLGHWAWVFMLCRSAFSIFHAAYRFVHIARTRVFRLWSSVRRELLCALASLPFLAATLTLRQAPRLYAVDASHWGGALVSTALAAKRRCVTTWRLHWGRQWQRPEHINALELRVLAPILPRHLQADIPVLSDSMVAIGVLQKGRSSSWHLNAIARRFHYLELLSGSRLCLQHVASADNPADAHSRGIRPWSVTKFSWEHIAHLHDIDVP